MQVMRYPRFHSWMEPRRRRCYTGIAPVEFGTRATRQVARLCGKPRGGEMGTRENEHTGKVKVWVCASCRFSNTSTREVCFSCHKIRTSIEEGTAPSQTWSCSLCDKENPSDVVQCTHCAAPAKDLSRKASHWLCPRCSYPNFSFRRECKMCRESRFQVKSWTCACGVQNMTNKPACSDCGKPNPSPPISSRATDTRTWVCPCGTMNVNAKLLCGQCLAPRPLSEDTLFPPPRVYQFDWRCICGSVNFERRSECYRCKTVRTKERPLVRYGTTELVGWHCSNCSSYNPKIRKSCVRCNAASTCIPQKNAGDHPNEPQISWTCVCSATNPWTQEVCFCGQKKKTLFSDERMTPLPPPPSQYKHSPTRMDWSCKCGCFNFARRENCYRCNHPRPGDPQAFLLKSLRGMEEREKRVDWTCSCGMVNFASRMECFRCSQPRETVEGENQERPEKVHYEDTSSTTREDKTSKVWDTQGDASRWLCKCGHLNYALTHSVSCASCRMERPLSDPMPKKKIEPRAGDWMCLECHALNFGSRSACFRCSAEREVLEQTRPRFQVEFPRRMGEREPDLWCCSCGTLNAAQTQKCFCGKERPTPHPFESSSTSVSAPEPFQKGKASSKQKEDSSSETASDSPPAPHDQQETTNIPSFSFTSESRDWTCVCEASNAGHRQNCFNCCRLRSEAFWTCSCSRRNEPEEKTCGSCSKVRKSEPPLKAENKPYQQDWICKSCRYHNFATRENCKRCGVTKHADSRLTPSAQGDHDWNCRFCGYQNFARRTLCMSCETARSEQDSDGPILASPSPKNVWTCPCGHQNLAHSMICEKCKLKSDTPSTKKLAPEGWTCKLCGWSNFSGRQTCMKCHTSPHPKEGEDSREAEPVATKKEPEKTDLFTLVTEGEPEIANKNRVSLKNEKTPLYSETDASSELPKGTTSEASSQRTDGPIKYGHPSPLPVEKLEAAKEGLKRKKGEAKKKALHKLRTISARRKKVPSHLASNATLPNPLFSTTPDGEIGKRKQVSAKQKNKKRTGPTKVKSFSCESKIQGKKTDEGPNTT